MLNHIIRLSLKYRSLVIIGSLIVLIYGSYLGTTMPIDVFPDLDRPRVVILTECPGLSPEEIETQVTTPIETSLLGAPGVQDVRSQSSQGMNVVYVEFTWNTEIRHARQIVAERLLTVTLPPDIRPVMTPPASIMGQIIHVGLRKRSGPQKGILAAVPHTDIIAERTIIDQKPQLTLWYAHNRNNLDLWEKIEFTSNLWSQNDPYQVTFDILGRRHTVKFNNAEQDRMELRSTAAWLVRPQLLKIQGIAEVILLGGDIQQYQVLVDPDKLLEFNVSLQEVESAIKSNNMNASGGYIEEGLTERLVRVIGRIGPDSQKALEDISRIVVKVNSERSVLLKNVANIVIGSAQKRGDASIDGQNGVVITIAKQPHSDTRQLTDSVQNTMHAIETSLTADYVIETQLFQLKSFIDRGVYYVEEALVIGGGLVVIVLFMFLLNIRTTLITLTAIPLSLCITTLIFKMISYITGQELSINVMTLGGIAVAMGELVDDAIVDVENIFRRLGENSRLLNPTPAILVVYKASQEIRSAIVFGTAVVILAFLPLFALSGIEGRLFTPLGIAYIVSILGSLIVSLTVTPVLSFYLLTGTKTDSHADSILLRFLKWIATGLIRFSMNHPTSLILLTWIFVGLSAWKLTTLGADFLPKFDEGSVQINITLPGGSSLKASNEASALIDAHLQSLQKSKENELGPILHFSRKTGRAELDEHANPVNMGEYILTMNPDSGISRDQFLKSVLKDLRDTVPGVEIEAEQPLSHLISHMLSGVNAQIAIKIFGDDLDKLREISLKTRDLIKNIDGVTPPIIDPQQRVDELHVVLRTEELAFYGLSREYVAEFVQTALKGESVTTIIDGQKRFDLIIKMKESVRSDPYRLGELRLDLPEKRGQIRLSEIADFPPSASGPNLVNRENVKRRQTIRCNVMDRDLESVVHEIEEQVRKEIKLPTGYFIEFGGQFEAQRNATRLITILALVSVAGIFTVLMMLFPSIRITLQILNAIPTAFIGGVIALVITHQTLTVASMVGFVSLGGIAVRNGILLVTHYFHLMKEEGESFNQIMILRGSLERLSPVLMTALTAGIGLIPLVINGQKPGLEILYPVATVILGGLVTSSFCEFLIHPGLFWKFSGKDAEKIAKEDGTDHDLLSNIS